MRKLMKKMKIKCKKQDQVFLVKIITKLKKKEILNKKCNKPKKIATDQSKSKSKKRLIMNMLKK